MEVAAAPGASVTACAGFAAGVAGAPSVAPARMSLTCGAPDMAHGAVPVLVNEIDANCTPLAPEPRSTAVCRFAHVVRAAGLTDVLDGLGAAALVVTGGTTGVVCVGLADAVVTTGLGDGAERAAFDDVQPAANANGTSSNPTRRIS
jgi:hypothetical protein